MSDLGETFAALREHNLAKKQRNSEKSRELLTKYGVEFKELSSTHLRVGGYDFWPSTGLWIHTKTKFRGRGIFRLLTLLGKI